MLYVPSPLFPSCTYLGCACMHSCMYSTCVWQPSKPAAAAVSFFSSPRRMVMMMNEYVVCMYVYRPPFCDCVHGKGQHPLDPGERSFRSKPGSQGTIGCNSANFAQGHYGWAEKPWRGTPSHDHSRHFLNWSFWELNQQPLLHKQGKSSTPLPEGHIAGCGSGSLKALLQTLEILHLPSTASPTSELSLKARLPYPSITGYAMTPPWWWMSSRGRLMSRPRTTTTTTFSSFSFFFRRSSM